jgi:SCY1-like protein 1
VPDSGRYSPPEVVRAGWNAIKSNPITAPDAYDYGILVYEVFNSGYASADQLSQPKSVPQTMQQSYKRLINANPKSRISIAQFLEQGQRNGGFFETPLIHLTDGIDNLGLKSDEERQEFLAYDLSIFRS